MWKEIPEFVGADDYARFTQFIDALIARGEVTEMDLDPDTIKISGFRWFRHPTSGEIWRLSPPDGKFRGSWKRDTADLHFFMIVNH